MALYDSGWWTQHGAAPGARHDYFAGTPEHVATQVQRQYPRPAPVQPDNASSVEVNSQKKPFVFVPQQMAPAAAPGQPVYSGRRQRIKLILEYPPEKPPVAPPPKLQYSSYEPFRVESYAYDPYAFGVDPARFGFGYEAGPVPFNAGYMYDEAWQSYMPPAGNYPPQPTYF